MKKWEKNGEWREGENITSIQTRKSGNGEERKEKVGGNGMRIMRGGNEDRKR